VPDEVELSDLGGSVPALLAFSPGWLGQQTDLLVVADRRYLYLGLARQLTDCQGHQNNLLNL